MIKQLLRAFIDNSVKYTRDGGEIRLECEGSEKGVCLSVCDDGIGMDNEELEHIFERFYRIDKARARASGGLGLGLSIAKAIVELHGGSVCAQSEKGNGTKVKVFLPDK